MTLVPRAEVKSEAPTPTLFSHLFNLYPHFTSINIVPPRPTIPVAFEPYRTKNGRQTPSDNSADHNGPQKETVLPETPIVPVRGAYDRNSSGAPNQNTTSDQNSSSGSPTISESTMRQVLEACLSARAPSLPETFPPEVGVIRLFTQSMYQGETTAISGCGCIDLETPFQLHSFVGSRNHSFTFFDDRGCSGDPYFQRFGQYHYVESDRTARSIRITQGVLAPIPANPASRQNVKSSKNK
ncbi:hypothetical protein BGW41_004648 [Actinomortierella wolfii]|nr:hypothetical protein BGW41_004648 [Actinomortierella wolfii]